MRIQWNQSSPFILKQRPLNSSRRFTMHVQTLRLTNTESTRKHWVHWTKLSGKQTNSFSLFFLFAILYSMCSFSMERIWPIIILFQFIIFSFLFSTFSTLGSFNHINHIPYSVLWTRAATCPKHATRLQLQSKSGWLCFSNESCLSNGLFKHEN